MDTTGQTLTPYEKEEISRKNSVKFFIDGVIFQAGNSFIEDSSVISVLVFLLTGSAGMSGLATVCYMLGMSAGKMESGAKISRISSIPKYVAGRVFIARSLLLIPAILLFFNIENYALSIILIVFYMLSYFFQGTTSAPWQDIYSRTMTARYRSTVLGSRQAFGGLLGVLSSIVVQRILANGAWNFKTQYGIILILGTSVMALGAIPILALKETERPVTDQHKNAGIVNLIKRAGTVLRRQKHFSNYLIVRILDMFVFTVVTFLIIASKDILHMTPAQTGVLVVMRTVGNAAGSFLSGWVSRKFGDKTVLTARMGLFIFMSLCGVLLTALSGIPVWFAYVFAVIGGVAQSTMLGFMLYMMYSAPPAARPDCITLDAIILLPFSFTSYLAGLMIDLAGYRAFFLLTGVLSVASLFLISARLLSKKEFDEIAGD